MDKKPFQPRSHQSHLQRSIQIHDRLGSIEMYRVGADWTLKSKPFQAAVRAAHLIAEKYPEPLFIPMSGGVDSECTMLAFLETKVPITPVIMHFEDGYNDFDTQTALSFCRKHGLTPLRLTLNLDDFFRREKHLEYAEKYHCRSPQLATHLWLADQVSSPLIFSYNPPPMIYLPQENIYYFGFPPELHLCYDRYFETNNRPGVGLFFLYTADLIYSFLQLPLSKSMILNPYFNRRYSPDNYFVKTELYRTGGFKTEARDYKATGFEKYREHLNTTYNFPSSKDYFDEMYRKPMVPLSKDQKLTVFGDIDLKRLYDSW